MTPLIALPAPWLPEPDAPEALAGDGLPQLPALSALLRRARRAGSFTDWRQGVQMSLGAGAGVAPVQLAAQALPAAARAGLCFAAPVHVVAGISRVHLPPGGRLQLQVTEEQAWCAAFNQEFGSASLRLHCAAAGGHWLLEAPFADAARDPAPEQLVGEALQRQPAAEPAARSLRRLGAEVEMWLAAHALNREREARREPVVNALWFWGGARALPPPRLRQPRAILTHAETDAWLAGLAGHCAVPVMAARNWQVALGSLAAGPPTGPAADPSSQPLLIVLAPDAYGTGRAYWRMLEENWFAPAWQALRTGEIAGLRLQIGRTAWQVPRRSPLQWLAWRRPSWWQRSGEARPWA